jgi:hypothetical protein
MQVPDEKHSKRVQQSLKHKYIQLTSLVVFFTPIESTHETKRMCQWTCHAINGKRKLFLTRRSAARVEPSVVVMTAMSADLEMAAQPEDVFYSNTACINATLVTTVEQCWLKA